MRWFYSFFFPVLWIVYLAYWQIAAAGAKANQRIEPTASRILRSVLFLTAVTLLSVPNLPVPLLNWHLMPTTSWSFYGGAIVTIAGLLFAVWARRHLGANWSRSVTVKEQHELITSGPYGLVRHPIYTGLLTGFLGTAIAITQIRGVVAFCLVAIALWAKLRLEEQWMRAQFGETYARYASRVPALVPGLK